MNGSTEHRASDADAQLDPQQTILNLTVARRMLPLLRRIVTDILTQRRILAELGLEQETLDRQRHTLAWPQRQRRYQVHEEVAAARRHLEEALAELEVLGVALVDPAHGQLGLPTVVNGRLAYFSWRPTETTIQFWQFPGESIRRPVPASWSESSPSEGRKSRR
jgi:hypothetical protein